MTAQQPQGAFRSGGIHQPGSVLGPYRVCAELARGGMATVYLAYAMGPRDFSRPVALKVIHPHLAADPDFVEMFLDEARISSCIRHPGVCSIVDFGEADGTWYLGMEYLQGECWRALMTRLRGVNGELRWALIAHVFVQACEALHAAHEAHSVHGVPLEIVHRDVSPQNLMIGYDGGVHLLDFGIASAINRVHHTADGSVKGRFAYMAPEQMQGFEVDRRADIWSLGVMLWEAVTGNRLFRRSTDAETILAAVRERIPAPGSVRPDIPPALVQAIDRALQREPDARYSTARELGRDLASFASRGAMAFGMADLAELMRREFHEQWLAKQAVMQDAHGLFQSDSLESVTEVSRVEGVPPGRMRGASTVPAYPSALALEEDAPASAAAVREPSDAGHQSGPRLALKARRRARHSTVGAAALALLAGALLYLFAVLVFPLALPVEGWSWAEAPEAVVQPGDPQDLVVLSPALLPGSAPGVSTSPMMNTGSVAPGSATPAPEQPSEPFRQARRVPPNTPSLLSTAAPGPRAGASSGSARAAVRRAHPPRALGHVNVVTPGGWAHVYLGKRRLGSTPGRFKLRMGRHLLTLRPFGKGPVKRRWVKVAPRRATRLRVPLR